jgi:peptidoglycan/LPS O-acetylase OafA/YrhL
LRRSGDDHVEINTPDVAARGDVSRLGYRSALDGVRGLAIVPVVSLHAFGLPKEGGLGVDLFFVLSGFLITTLLLEEFAEAGGISLSSFYRRRAARLLPALAVLLVAAAFAARHLSDWLAIAFASTYTLNIAAASQPYGHFGGVLGHLWSLAAEEQFYLLWPPLLIIALRRGRPRLERLLIVLICAVAIERLVLALQGAGIARLYFAPDTHADPILVGCLFAVLWRSGRVAISRIGGPLAMVIVVSCFLTLDRSGGLLLTTPLRTAFAIACAVMIVSAVRGGSINHILELRPLTFLGRISYSLYLWHWPVLVWASAAVGDDHPIRTALLLPAVVAIATASYYGVERPLRARWRRPPAARIAVPAGHKLTPLPAAGPWLHSSGHHG